MLNAVSIAVVQQTSSSKIISDR